MMVLYILSCDGVFNQAFTDLIDANREKANLKKMGFHVTMQIAADWKTVFATEDKYR